MAAPDGETDPRPRTPGRLAAQLTGPEPPPEATQEEGRPVAPAGRERRPYLGVLSHAAPPHPPQNDPPTQPRQPHASHTSSCQRPTGSTSRSNGGPHSSPRSSSRRARHSSSDSYAITPSPQSFPAAGSRRRSRLTSSSQRLHIAHTASRDEPVTDTALPEPVRVRFDTPAGDALAAGSACPFPPSPATGTDTRGVRRRSGTGHAAVFFAEAHVCFPRSDQSQSAYSCGESDPSTTPGGQSWVTRNPRMSSRASFGM